MAQFEREQLVQRTSDAFAGIHAKLCAVQVKKAEKIAKKML